MELGVGARCRGCGCLGRPLTCRASTRRVAWPRSRQHGSADLAAASCGSGTPATSSSAPAEPICAASPLSPVHGLATKDRVAAEDGGAVAALVTWLLARGGAVSEAVEVRTGSAGERGLFAKSRIAKGEVIISVPRECHIVANGPEDPALAALGPGHRGQSTRLAARLLREGAHTQAPNLDFAAYYRSLPRFIDVPLTWEAKDLLSLADCRALSVLRTHKRRLVEQFAAIRRSEGLEGVSWDDFLWAMSVLLSRNFNWRPRGAPCPVDAQGKSIPQLCLVPFLDIANHHPAATEFTHYGARDGAMVLTCKSDIQAGQEILISYGQLGNEELLVQYGFALEENICEDGSCPDEVGFQLLVQPQLFGWKAQLLKAAGYQMDGSHPIRIITTCLSNVSELLSVLRLYVADTEDVARLQAREPPLQDAHAVAAFSARNECQAMTLLWKYAAAACVSLRIGAHPEPMVRALGVAAEAVVRSALEPQSRIGPSSANAAPAIVAVVEEAFRQCGAVAEQEPLLDRRSQMTASECAGGGPPDEDPAAASARHAELARRVVASERRVFEHFAALAAASVGAMRLQAPDRANFVKALAAAPILAGLSSASRDSIARTVASQGHLVVEGRP